jgi:hypothetical protein
MGKKITWYESYKTVCKYSAELTDEEAKLFEEDQDRFFEEVDYQANQELEWDDVEDNDFYDFELEDSED